MVDVNAWVITWFEQEANIDIADLKRGTCKNYFEQGWIDSLLFIKLIVDIEEVFDIRFEPEAFSDPGFQTLSGIIRIIEKAVET